MASESGLWAAIQEPFSARWSRGEPGAQDTVQEADALLLAVHWTRLDDELSQAGDLSGQVIYSGTGCQLFAWR